MREANDPHRIRFLQLRTASFSPAAHELDQLRAAQGLGEQWPASPELHDARG